jgi:hypothetical protein
VLRELESQHLPRELALATVESLLIVPPDEGPPSRSATPPRAVRMCPVPPMLPGRHHGPPPKPDALEPGGSPLSTAYGRGARRVLRALSAPDHVSTTSATAPLASHRHALEPRTPPRGWAAIAIGLALLFLHIFASIATPSLGTPFVWCWGVIIFGVVTVVRAAMRDPSARHDVDCEDVPR